MLRMAGLYVVGAWLIVQEVGELTYLAKLPDWVGMTVVMLAPGNLRIAGNEGVVREGATILLHLVPVDPRSLMQGDYMALRCGIMNDVERTAREAESGRRQ